MATNKKTGKAPEERLEADRRLLELLAAIFIAAEHVETCEARAQHNLIAGVREVGRAAHGLGERAAERVRDAKGGAVKAQLLARLTDQQRMLHARRDPMHKSGQIPPF